MGEEFLLVKIPLPLILFIPDISCTHDNVLKYPCINQNHTYINYEIYNFYLSKQQNERSIQMNIGSITSKLRISTSALALTMGIGMLGEVSAMDVVQPILQIQDGLHQNTLNQEEMNQYAQKYVPHTLGRGAFESFRCGITKGYHFTIINGIFCIVPGTADILAPEKLINEGVLNIFQSKGNIPCSGPQANGVFYAKNGYEALEKENNTRDFKIDFESLYLTPNSCEAYCENINGYFTMVGFKASYQYFGEIRTGHGMCTTPEVLFLLNKEDYQKINEDILDQALESGFEVISELKDLEGQHLYDALAQRVPKNLGRFSLNALMDSPFITINSVYGTPLECIIYGSRKKFISKLPSTAAVITQTMHPNLKIMGTPSIVWENGNPIGVQASYNYTGRDAYTLSYNDADRELPVLFRFTEEEARLISLRIECPEDRKAKVLPEKWEPSWASDDLPIRVLSLDGGGIRGIGEAELLRALGKTLWERKGKKLNEYFDVIVGTSTGGILAIAIGMDIDYEKLVGIYVDNAEEIFQKVGSQYQFKGVQYDHNNLKNVFKRCLAEKTGMENPPLSLAKTHVAVTSYESDRQHSSLLTSETVKNGDINNKDKFISAGYVSAIKIARTTSAAPVYFKGTELFSGALECSSLRKQGKRFLQSDGGVTVNRPIAQAYHYTYDLQNRGILPSNRKIQILSLGTGWSKLNGYAADAGGLEMVTGEHLLNHIGDGAQVAAFESNLEFLQKLGVETFIHNFYLKTPIDLAAKDEISLMRLRLAGIDETRTAQWDETMNKIIPSQQ